MSDSTLPVIGWREWLALPALGVRAMKAKIDTGARSSSMRVQGLRVLERRRGALVCFDVPEAPDAVPRAIRVPMVDSRLVTDSGGHRSLRPFIRTVVELNGQRWSIEINLTERADMLFPLLLGRTALAGRFVVDSAASWRFGRPALF